MEVSTHDIGASARPRGPRQWSLAGDYKVDKAESPASATAAGNSSTRDAPANATAPAVLNATVVANSNPSRRDAPANATALAVLNATVVANPSRGDAPANATALAVLNATVVANPSRRNASLPTLFCFLVASTFHQEEIDLVRYQWHVKKGIFACEAARAYGDQRLPLQPGSDDTPYIIPHYMRPSSVATAGWLANLEVFMKVWGMVVAEGVYKSHSVTVKTDPDAVYLPWRLRHKIAHIDPEKPWYIHNCMPGKMQGPLEVLSRAAVELYTNVSFRDRTCSEKMTWQFQIQEFGAAPGEDMFLDHCLGWMGVEPVLDIHTLADQNCMWNASEGCGGQGYDHKAHRPAYHWFKSVPAWKKCLQEAIEAEP